MEINNKEFDLAKFKPDVRKLNDMEEVLFDQTWWQGAANIDLYYMYRKLKTENGLRYDITIIPPNMLGQEFVKTKGHIHAGFYGEVYMVLDGEGIYFAQLGDENEIKDVFAVHGKKGDVIIIPAGYGHVTINSGAGQLKTANWIAEHDKGNFNMFEKNQGACYYYVASGHWIKNTKYKQVPELRFEEPLKEVPKDLSFLKAK